MSNTPANPDILLGSKPACLKIEQRNEGRFCRDRIGLSPVASDRRDTRALSAGPLMAHPFGGHNASGVPITVPARLKYSLIRTSLNQRSSGAPALQYR